MPIHINVPDTKYKCDFCGQEFPARELVIIQSDDHENLYTCANCYQYYHTCHTCANGKICGFESDTTEPQFVTQYIQRGFMTMQAQTPNPNLIEKHCVNCRCYSEEPKCLKRTTAGANCSNYRFSIT